MEKPTFSNSDRKFFIAGVVFMLIIFLIRPVISPALNRGAASCVVLLLGFLMIFRVKLFTDTWRQLPEAPLLFAFRSRFGWLFIGWGLVGLADAALF
jgi:hypothetical protein